MRKARRLIARRHVSVQQASNCIEKLEQRMLLSGQIFVVNSGTSPDVGTIGEYNTDGTTVNASLVSGLDEPDGIVLSGSDLFVVNSGAGALGEYTTSGATVNADLVAGAGGQFAVSGSNLFVIDAMDTIGEDTTAGATVNTALITGLAGPYGIATSGSDLFVTNTRGGDVGEGFIEEFTTDGVRVSNPLVSG
jgi:hypothetical protein